MAERPDERVKTQIPGFLNIFFLHWTDIIPFPNLIIINSVASHMLWEGL